MSLLKIYTNCSVKLKVKKLKEHYSIPEYLLAGPGGFEPPLTGPKPGVLPLDDGPIEE